jgi:ribonucleoside-diphosphate reductase alpha chain
LTLDKIVRPKRAKGVTPSKELGCGTLYITINHGEEDMTPIEVMASLGKQGTCTACQNEALTRMVTLALKYHLPISEIVGELKNIECPSKRLWPEEERALSCADAIGRALEEYMEKYCENH